MRFLLTLYLSFLDRCLSIHFLDEKALGAFLSILRNEYIARHPAPGHNIYVGYLVIGQNFQNFTRCHWLHLLKDEHDQFTTTRFPGIKLDISVHKLQYTPQLAHA